MLTLAKTIFWMQGAGMLTVRVFIAPMEGAGFFVYDAGALVLSPGLYSQMPNAGEQRELKKFVSKLQRISLAEIPLEMQPDRLRLGK